MTPIRKVAWITLVLLVACAPPLFAQVTVPHEFEAGETARAADVNENFDALEDAATANALGVSDNAADVAVNAEGVAANAAAVATQNANIGANATSITTNSVGIAGNSAAISTLNATAGMNSVGVSANAGGISTNAAGIELNANSTIGLATTVDSNSVSIDGIASDLSLVEGDISLNADEIASLVADITQLRTQLVMFEPPELRFEVCGDGTIADQKEGLLWEQKTGVNSGTQKLCDIEDCDDDHDGNNAYRWSVPNSFEPNGSLFTLFLAGLNDSEGPVGCFAGHCDWRIPTLAELGTIIQGAAASGRNHSHVCTRRGSSPCLVDGYQDLGFSGTSTWTTTFWNDTAYFIRNFNGDADFSAKDSYYSARAVRTGSCTN